MNDNTLKPRLVLKPRWPELIEPVAPTRKATHKNLHKIQQRVLLANAEAMLEESFKVLRMKIRAGDTSAIKLSFEVNSMVKAPGGVNVNTQINNANRTEVADNKVFSFEGIVRRLDARTQDLTTLTAATLTPHDETE